MDFKNLCQKIDVDSIRAKIPPLPAMPQLKLPKSITKLKSRKIFRSSRENVSGATPKQHPQQQQQQPQHNNQMVMPSSIPQADFIKRPPTRISTISSLVHHHQTEIHIEENTYRSANSIDEDYPSPTQFSRVGGGLHPISSLRPSIDEGTAGNDNPKLSLAGKIQKSYKDLSEFKFKHIFSKKTVIRKDNIRVDHYVERYNEERQIDEMEEQLRNEEISENYRFKFKVSRQNTGHTDSLSSHESPTKVAAALKTGRSVSELSGDESGMESSPLNSKQGIAANRFARVRHPPLCQSMSDESIEVKATIEEAHTPKALWSIKINRTPVEASPIVTGESSTVPVTKSKGLRERFKHITDYVSSHDESGNESGPDGTKTGMLSKVRNIGRHTAANQRETTNEKKRKAPLTPQQSEECLDQKTSSTPTENPLSVIKHNFKRFQKSIKRQSASTEESDDEDGHKPERLPTKTEKLTARLRKFKSQEPDDPDATKDETNTSPVRAAIASRFETLKKSLKKKPSANENENSPEKEKRPGTLMKKLNYIRSRKHPGSVEDLDYDDEENEASTSKKTKDTTIRRGINLEEKFVNARQRTLKKMNEKLQHMKFFHKSQEHATNDDATPKSSEEEDEPEKSKNANVPPTITRRGIQDNECADELEAIEDFTNKQEYAQRARTSWTTKPILSESIESDMDAEFPRILIHQDNSDAFESTLIISVTRPAASPASPSPIITEIPPERRTPTPSKSAEWIPNREIISRFLDMTPPTKRKMSTESQSSTSRRHSRKHSMDSNSDSDSWIPDNIRGKHIDHGTELIRRTSTAGLNSIVENEEIAWKVHSMYSDEKIYKTNSIDIFERNAQKGGLCAAFEDFDVELVNEPVMKIVATIKAENSEKEDSEEVDIASDEANSSQTTMKLSKDTYEEDKQSESKQPKSSESQLRQIGNSIESLIANFDENDEIDSDDEDDEDRPPSAAPSPPPKHSPPPPPLPQRRPSVRGAKAAAEQSPMLPPPLPFTRPPLPPPANPPPRIPERTASMTRLARPLVKTSSLRLTFEEQVQPADIGKVNKLISRFEQPKITERPRLVARRIIQDDSEEYSDEDAEDDVEVNENDIKSRVDRDITPTPTNTPRSNSLNSDECSALEAFTNADNNDNPTMKPIVITKDVENNITIESAQQLKSLTTTPNTSTNLVRNSSYSRPNSEYGSPLEYPSSLIGSTESTPISDRKVQEMRNARRNRRSMTRDEDNFYSFDSDEENSYYSISSSGSSRYVVEL